VCQVGLVQALSCETWETGIPRPPPTWQPGPGTVGRRSEARRAGPYDLRIPGNVGYGAIPEPNLPEAARGGYSDGSRGYLKLVNPSSA
jgi:hypothetical protein